MKNDYRGPLAGLYVLEFGHYYAGPMTGMLLADQGAHVVKIIKPGEPELPPPQYRLLNRNKKLLVLDLKTPEGVMQAQALIEQADVLIENFRPGVMARLGLDYAHVKENNPRLVYLSLPGFSSQDKERAGIQAWEGVLAAAAGVYTDTHPLRDLLNFPPVYTWVPQCSAYGAMHGAIAVMSALVSRTGAGCGTVIEVPLADAGLSGFAPYFAHDALGAPRTGNTTEASLPKALKPFEYQPGDSQEAQMQKLRGANEPRMAPFYGTPYLCADGRKILFHGADGIKLCGRILKVLGLDKRLKNEGFVNEGPWVLGIRNNISNAWNLDPEKSRYIKGLITDAMLAKTAEEWETLMQSARIAVSIIRTREEWLAVPALSESAVFTQMDNGESKLTVPGRIADMSGTQNTLIDTVCSEMEAITVEQARAFPGTSLGTGASLGTGTISREAEIPLQPPKKGDLLKDLKVVDFSYIVAGPTSSYTLAQYGAQVIKVHPPVHEHPGLIKGMLDANQGKRSLLLQVNTVPGREVFARLVAWADVVVHNYPDDTAKRMGLSLPQLQAINPRVVGCQLTAFGGTYRGGWEKRRGFDPMAQAASGLMAQFGTLEEPHWHGQTSCGDTMGGLGLAFSALLGIYQLRTTGYAGEGRTSLARMINFIQLPCMIAENGKSQWGEAHGQFAVGPHWWQRLYQCSDGWIYVGAHQDDTPKLTDKVLVDQVSEADIAQTLEDAFVQREQAFWVKALNNAGIGCHQVVSVTDFCKTAARSVSNEPADEMAAGSAEILCWDDHPCGYPVILGAPDWVRVGESHSYKRLAPAPRFGQHTREVLQELGYSEKQINELIDLQICFEYFPAMGSKDAYFFDWSLEIA